MTKDNLKRVQRLEAKLDMISLLLRGHSFIIFPETTWNLSPNKLHLPLNWGFTDIAKKAGAPIVPMVIEYSYDFRGTKDCITKIHIKYGEPMRVALEDSI